MKLKLLEQGNGKIEFRNSITDVEYWKCEHDHYRDLLDSYVSDMQTSQNSLTSNIHHTPIIEAATIQGQPSLLLSSALLPSCSSSISQTALQTLLDSSSIQPPKLSHASTLKPVLTNTASSRVPLSATSNITKDSDSHQHIAQAETISLSAIGVVRRSKRINERRERLDMLKFRWDSESIKA